MPATRTNHRPAPRRRGRFPAAPLVLAAAVLVRPIHAPAALMSSASFSIPAAAVIGGGAVGMQSQAPDTLLGAVSASIGSTAPIGTSRSGGGTFTCAAGLWAAVAGGVDAGTPTRTPSVSTPTRSATPAGSRSATPTRTPAPPTSGATRTATRTPTPTATGPTRTATPTRTPFPPGFHPRGDADCNESLSAADVVATILSVSGSRVCENDDCDRDGAVTAADIDCAACCLFGQCPAPLDGPDLTGMAPRPAGSCAHSRAVELSKDAD